jgi:Na+-translocating ferredoxin:NAD+ oxidoreductase RnfD subunit
LAKPFSKKDTRLRWTDTLVMLALPLVSACYFYGLRALKLTALSVVTAVLCEAAGRFLMRTKATVGDVSAVVTGAAIALMLPAGAPWWLPVVGSSFAIIAAKLPFGRVETLPFSPAAAGFAFITVCFPELVFRFPVVGSTTGSAGVSLAAMLASNTKLKLVSVKALDLVTGNFPGPMGACCLIVLTGSFIYMLIRRPKSTVSVLGFLAGAALIGFALPRVNGRLDSALLEVAAGTTLFSALFLLSEPGTQPKNPVSCLLFGLVGGAIAVLMRHFGPYEDCGCFAVLVADALWPVFDRALFNGKAEPAPQTGGRERQVREHG